MFMTIGLLRTGIALSGVVLTAPCRLREGKRAYLPLQMLSF